MTLHLLNIGDCRVLIEKAGKVSSLGTSNIERLETAPTTEITHPRETMGETHVPWPRLRDTLRRNFEAAVNKPDGYWVVHPTLSWLPAVDHARIPLTDVDHVLLASDGFFRLMNDLGAYDAAGLIEQARREGGLGHPLW